MTSEISWSASRNRTSSKPREVDPSIPRPLEAICLKAMARSMSARYQTAAELAADIEAFLADEPVSAWKEPAAVRAARWVRRHRTLVSTGGATVAVLLLALAIIVFLQSSANRRLTVANNNEKAARTDAENQRDKAQQNFQMAQDAVDRYFTQVSEDPRLAAHGLEPLRRDSVEFRRTVLRALRRPGLKKSTAQLRKRVGQVPARLHHGGNRLPGRIGRQFRAGGPKLPRSGQDRRRHVAAFPRRRPHVPDQPLLTL